MSDKEFEVLLKSLTDLTERKIIKWEGDAKAGYSLDLESTRLRISKHSSLGVMLSIANTAGNTVAIVSSSSFPISPGVELFKSSIPNYLYELITKQFRKTDETLNNLLSNLQQLSDDSDK